MQDLQENIISITTAQRPGSLKVCNALAGMLSDLDSALDAANRIKGAPKLDGITKTLEQARANIKSELTLAKLRHDASIEKEAIEAHFMGKDSPKPY